MYVCMCVCVRAFVCVFVRVCVRRAISAAFENGHTDIRSNGLMGIWTVTFLCFVALEQAQRAIGAY